MRRLELEVEASSEDRQNAKGRIKRSALRAFG